MDILHDKIQTGNKKLLTYVYKKSLNCVMCLCMCPETKACKDTPEIVTSYCT